MSVEDHEEWEMLRKDVLKAQELAPLCKNNDAS